MRIGPKSTLVQFCYFLEKNWLHLTAVFLAGFWRRRGVIIPSSYLSISLFFFPMIPGPAGWSVITSLDMDMDNSEFLKISDQVGEGDAVSAWTEGEALENPPVEEPEVPQWQEKLWADHEPCLGRTGQSTHNTQNCRKSQSQVLVFICLFLKYFLL